MSNRINYNSIPSDYVSRFRLDGNGNNDIGSNNAIVTNAIWSNSDKHYQLKNLNWGATTSFTYTVITYTNSYVFINGVFTKNSTQVTSTALNGVNLSLYSGLIFYNRTLSASEEQAIKLEGDRLFGDKPNYPQLLRGLKAYYDFKGGSLSNLVDGTNATNNGATLTTDHLGRANNAYSFNGVSSYITGQNIILSENTTHILSMLITIGQIGKTQSIVGTYQNMSNVFYSELGLFSDNRFFFGITKQNVLNNSIFSTTTAIVGNTYKVNGLYNGTTLYLYINGILEAQINRTFSSSISVSLPLNIGFQPFYTTSQNKFNGTISQVIIQNQALNSSEVKELYNLTSKEYIYPFSKSSLLSLEKGLVIHLDSNGVDLSGNGNNGTPTAVTPTRRGQSEGGIYNGGTSEIVNIPFNGLPTTASEITISFGAIPKNNTVQTTIINTGINTANWINIYLPWNNNIIYWDFGNITNGRLSTAFDITWLNQLAHWVFVSGPNGMQIYRNNKLLATQVSSASYSKGAEVMSLGKYTATGTHWTGNIYSPKIRNRALTPKEVEMEYYLNYIN